MNTHQLIEPLTWLKGKWTGKGTGGFPTMDNFLYENKMSFHFLVDAMEVEPLIQFEEIAWVLVNGEKEFKHWETGFFKPALPGKIQFYVVHNTGRIEITYGEIVQLDTSQKTFTISLESTTIRNDEGLTIMHKSKRELSLKNNMLTYTLAMATEDVEQWTEHLNCKLVRT